MIKASPKFAKQKIAKSTKNLERAIIPFNLLLFNASVYFLTAVSVQFADVT
jgi:hypothetical protein